jgi:hypothetical protein
MIGVKLFVLRVDKPNINKSIGDVIDVLSADEFEGTEVQKLHANYICVVVTDVDLDDELVTSLKSGFLYLRKPEVVDPFYTELFTNGITTIDKATLLNYVESKDA